MFVLMQGSTPGAIPVELATITTAEGHLKRHKKDIQALEKAATNEVMKEVVTKL